MSLNMYLGEINAQSQSMNHICNETIHGMEKTIRSIDIFRGSIRLQGKSYISAKNFMAQTHRPLAQGIIYLCDLDWVAKLDEIHYTRKAEEQYGEYLNKHPGCIYLQRAIGFYINK